MLSTVNLLKDYKENKGKIFAYLKKLEKKDIYKLYKQIKEYEDDMLYKNLHEETLISMIDLALHRLVFNENVSNVIPELKYKGKYPEKYQKKISKIAEQLDKDGKY